jgi:hypothetical protein
MTTLYRLTKKLLKEPLEGPAGEASGEEGYLRPGAARSSPSAAC